MKNLRTFEGFVGIKENHTMNEFRSKFDVSKSKDSLAGKVESLIGEMDRMKFEDIKNKFSNIVNDPDTHASPKTRAKWNDVLNRAKDKMNLMKAITNMYLAGAKMSVGESEDQKDKRLGRITEFEKYVNH